jgi:hypothetical protein
MRSQWWIRSILSMQPIPLMENIKLFFDWWFDFFSSVELQHRGCVLLRTHTSSTDEAVRNTGCWFCWLWGLALCVMPGCGCGPCVNKRYPITGPWGYKQTHSLSLVAGLKPGSPVGWKRYSVFSPGNYLPKYQVGHDHFLSQCFTSLLRNNLVFN